MKNFNSLLYGLTLRSILIIVNIIIINWSEKNLLLFAMTLKNLSLFLLRSKQDWIFDGSRVLFEPQSAKELTVTLTADGTTAKQNC